MAVFNFGDTPCEPDPVLYGKREVLVDAESYEPRAAESIFDPALYTRAPGDAARALNKAFAAGAPAPTVRSTFRTVAETGFGWG